MTDKNRICKDCEKTTKVVHIMGISEEESETESEEISETIKTENAPFLINIRHQTTDPGNSENTKDKCKKTNKNEALFLKKLGDV